MHAEIGLPSCGRLFYNFGVWACAMEPTAGEREGIDFASNNRTDGARAGAPDA